MNKIDWMTEAECRTVEAMLDAICQQFDAVGDKINGRVPARVIDKWLALHRKLHDFKINGVPDGGD